VSQRTGVVVTGMGMVTPVGTTAAEVMDAMCEGRSGLSRPAPDHPLYDSLDVAGFGPPIDPTTVLPAPETRVMDRYIVMALRAAATRSRTRASRSGATWTRTASRSSCPGPAAWPPSKPR